MSSGNGDGGGFFDNVVNVDSLSGKGNFFENIVHDTINAGLQGATGGLLGFEDGKISNGASTNGLKKVGMGFVSGLKEVTGAKAAEQANKVATQQFEEQKAAGIEDRQNAYRQAGLQQIQQSQLAGAARNTSRAASNRSNTYLGGDEKDFLGL
jgi:hypothetical protein